MRPAASEAGAVTRHHVGAVNATVTSAVTWSPRHLAAVRIETARKVHRNDYRVRRDDAYQAIGGSPQAGGATKARNAIDHQIRHLDLGIGRAQPGLGDGVEDHTTGRIEHLLAAGVSRGRYLYRRDVGALARKQSAGKQRISAVAARTSENDDVSIGDQLPRRHEFLPHDPGDGARRAIHQDVFRCMGQGHQLGFLDLRDGQGCG